MSITDFVRSHQFDEMLLFTLSVGSADRRFTSQVIMVLRHTCRKHEPEGNWIWGQVFNTDGGCSTVLWSKGYHPGIWPQTI